MGEMVTKFAIVKIAMGGEVIWEGAEVIPVESDNVTAVEAMEDPALCVVKVGALAYTLGVPFSKVVEELKGANSPAKVVPLPA